MYCYQTLIEKGFLFIAPETYFENGDTSLAQLNESYEAKLQPDGPRNRAYLKLEWCRDTNIITISKNQCYFQTAEKNQDDGGKPRQFAVMNSSVLQLQIIKNILRNNIKIISEYKPLLQNNKLVFGLHFIQYIVEKNKASYSSPAWLHIDDEPLVFVHLIELSSNAIGGDNLIARLDDQEITHVIRLENPMDTLLLNNNCYHAVTPLGARDNTSRRNILLFTVEPETTQILTPSKGN